MYKRRRGLTLRIVFSSSPKQGELKTEKKNPSLLFAQYTWGMKGNPSEFWRGVIGWILPEVCFNSSEITIYSCIGGIFVMEGRKLT